MQAFGLGCLLGIAVWLCGQPGHAHIGDRIYPIFELTDADLNTLDLADGRIDEWTALFPTASLSPADFTIVPDAGQAAPYDPADLDYRIWLAWNGTTSRLYFAMERLDDIYINTYEPIRNTNNMWRFDSSIVLLIDGDHSGEDFTGSANPDWSDEERTFHNNRTAQLYHALADAPDQRHLDFDGAAANWVTLPPYASGSGRSRPVEAPTAAAQQIPGAHTVLEFYVTPFDHLVWNIPDQSRASVLAADRIVGLDISVPDFDTAPTEYRAFHTLSQGFSTWRFASEFVDARLIPAHPQTSVAPDTWGRIKASLGAD